MAPAGVNNNTEKGMGDAVSDVWGLVRDYAKQETISPLTSLKQLFKWGLAGAACLAVGLFFGCLAVLRGVQSEGGSAVTGNLSWIPYLAAFVFAVLAGVLAFRGIKRPQRADQKGR